MSKTFWPGYQWRILAHMKATESRKPDYTGHQVNISNWTLRGPVEFDELVIDDWFHIEQMDSRHWWIGVGNGDDYWHVNVHIDGKGKASVSMEKQ